ncbi:MAG: DUF2207 domain-containing protein [Ruminococcus sp.]|nr:DUF2207 domain-containing protein [Ruminococcus sp.]
MKHTKQIETKKTKILKIIDRLVLIVPVIILISVLLHENGYKYILESFAESSKIGFVMIFLLILATFSTSFPIVAITRAITHTMRKNAVKATTFNVLTDFEYYREKLTGISPAEISMLTDLNIELSKDISATILKYTLMGIVDTSQNQVIVLNDNHPGLKPSDRFLINSFKNNTFNGAVAFQWRNMAKKEVINGRFLRNKKLTVGTTTGNCISCSLGCLFPIIVLLITYIFASTPTFESYSNMLDAIPENTSNAEAINILFNTPSSSLFSFMLMIIGISIPASLIVPIVVAIWVIVKTFTGVRYERTYEGQVLTEEIYGIKNFIHDFSDLSNADKNRLILWDDFLIYAVLLEENESIINEIIKLKNVNLIKFKI